jgi:hypothetical protein
MVGPYTPGEAIEHVIEPVRIVGWRGGKRPVGPRAPPKRRKTRRQADQWALTIHRRTG